VAPALSPAHLTSYLVLGGLGTSLKKVQAVVPIGTGSERTNQITSSSQGGKVKDPLYL